MGSRSACSVKYCAIQVHAAPITGVHEVETARNSRKIDRGHPESSLTGEMDDLHHTLGSPMAWAMNYRAIQVHYAGTTCVNEVATALKPIRIDGGHPKGILTGSVHDLHHAMGSQGACFLHYYAILVHRAATICVHEVPAAHTPTIIDGDHPQSFRAG